MSEWEEVLSELEQTRLKEVFDALDTDGDGYVSVDDLKKAVKNAGFDVSSEQAEAAVARADFDGTGSVSWENFAAAMILLGIKILILLYLRFLFDQIDADNTGFITLDQLKQICDQSGLSEHVDNDQIENVFNTMDESGDGKVDFGDFLTGLADIVREKMGD